MRRALRRVLIGMRPAEIDQQPVAQVIADAAAPMRHLGAAGLDKTRDQRLEVLRIERRRQTGEIHQIAEQHGDLSPFTGVAAAQPLGAGGGHRQIVQRPQQPLARAQRQADLAQIGIGQAPEDIEADVMLFE